jgi:hypothetical protein
VERTPGQVKAGKQTLRADHRPQRRLRLNLLDSPFAEHDLNHLGKLQISVEDARTMHSDSSLAISSTLRGKLLEAHGLIYDDLEDDEVSQWVHRVKRLSELGLEEEASELEQSLIELTRNDPELQTEFLKSLTKDAGRLVADPGRTKRSEHRGQIESPAKAAGRHPGTTAQTTPSARTRRANPPARPHPTTAPAYRRD